jgi:hypothetical protein
MKRLAKVVVTSALVMGIVIVLYFFLAIYSHGGGLYLHAEKERNTPENYVEVTMTELEKYPYVKQAVMNPTKEIRVPFNDKSTMEFLKILWDANRTEYIKFGQDYYRIKAICAD